MRPQHAKSINALRSRLATAALHTQWSPAVARTARPLATTSALRLPRSARTPKGTRASTTTATVEPAAPAEDGAAADPPEEEGSATPEGGEEPPTPPSFPAIVTTLTTPGAPTEPLASEHHILFNHLATSFVPTNQPTGPARDNGSRDRPSIISEGPRGVFLPQAGGHHAAEERPSNAAGEDPVIALVSPFEGGDAYISRAIHEVAAHLSADVVRLDLALGVGFDGPFAPLAETGESQHASQLTEKVSLPLPSRRQVTRFSRHRPLRPSTAAR